MVEENSGNHGAGTFGGDSSCPWQTLASGFEQARAREDSLDRLIEWPAQRALLGDVTRLAVLAKLGSWNCGVCLEFSGGLSDARGVDVVVDVSIHGGQSAA
jgi:hypothetical protein